MATKRFAFILDPLEKLDLPWDTSLCLVRELHRQGQSIYYFEASSLFMLSGKIWGVGRKIDPRENHRYEFQQPEKFQLDQFDVIFIRKDPPFDASYLALTYLLEPLTGKTIIINRPRGLRNANEKLFGLIFKRWTPPTLVSANPEEVLRFQESIHSDLVIKPLYEKGGKGVFLLIRRGGSRARPFMDAHKGRPYKQKLRTATCNGTIPVVAQKFIPLENGAADKRILLWKGKILGAFKRIPKKGEFRANLSLGARFAACSVTSQEKKLVEDLRPHLLKEGLWFVGLDVRGEFLIEINVTSPAGLVELDQLYGHVTKKVARTILRL